MSKDVIFLIILNMGKRNLYIIIAVVLVVGLALSFYSNLTGYGTENPVLGKCMDTDGGDNPYSPGTVSYKNAGIGYKDECYTKSEGGVKKYLKERYCIESMVTKLYLCRGGCSENKKGEGYCNEGEADILYQ